MVKANLNNGYNLLRHFKTKSLIKMKKYVLVLALILMYLIPKAQTAKNKTQVMKVQEIEDRIAIKELVDTFSILADQKETDKQRYLFTENGVVTSKVNGQPGLTLTGRKQLGDAFEAYLANFETVYHINGQLSLTLNGNKASGISYCMVTLIGNENGKKIKTSMGVYYNDEYVRENNRWLIAKRTSNFAWQDKQPLGQ